MAAKQPDRTHGDAPEARAADSKVRDIQEYRSGLDDTLPPTPLKQLLAAGGATVFVLSADAELCETVQRAGGEQYPVFTVTAWQELVDAIESGRCGIALIDADLIGAKLEKRIAELERYASRLVTLVAADRAGAQPLIGYLSERKIHRLLIKPPALGITRLLLESAVSRCIQLRERPGEPGPERRTEVRPPRAGAARSAVPAWVLATGLVALLLGVATVAGFGRWWQRAPSASSAAAPPATSDDGAAASIATAVRPPVATLEPVPAAADRFAELLARAERAFSEGRIAAPLGDNALDYYRTILAADPQHAIARTRLEQVLETLFAGAERALLDSSYDAAAVALAAIRRADEGSSRLAFLEAQLARVRGEQAEAAAAAEAQSVTAQQLALTVEPRPNAAGAAANETVASEQDAAAPAPPTELDSLLAIASARLARGQLVEPAGDSALAYLQRALQIDSTDARVAAQRAEVGAALIAAARSAADAGDLDRAAALVTSAGNLGAAANSIAAVGTAIERLRSERTQQRHAQIAATVRERLESDALLAPTGDSAIDHLQTLQAEGATLEELPELWDALTSALTANVRSSMARRDWPGAAAWVAALARTGRDVASAEQLERQVTFGRLQEQYLATAAPASELSLLANPPVEYPRDLAVRGIEGWVDVQFVVDRMGNVRDAVVVAAQPPRRFEAAALAAVARYRYAPFARDGQTYERRLQLRVRFTLQ